MTSAAYDSRLDAKFAKSTGEEQCTFPPRLCLADLQYVDGLGESAVQHDIRFAARAKNAAGCSRYSPACCLPAASRKESFPVRQALPLHNPR